MTKQRKDQPTFPWKIDSHSKHLFYKDNRIPLKLGTPFFASRRTNDDILIYEIKYSSVEEEEYKNRPSWTSMRCYLRITNDKPKKKYTETRLTSIEVRFQTPEKRTEVEAFVFAHYYRPPPPAPLPPAPGLSGSRPIETSIASEAEGEILYTFSQREAYKFSKQYEIDCQKLLAQHGLDDEYIRTLRADLLKQHGLD